MRVIEPHQLRSYKSHRPKKTAKRSIAIALLLVLVSSVGLAVWAYSRPVPLLEAQSQSIKSLGRPVVINWPHYGQASIGDVENGILANTADQKPVPIASIAKVVTALAVLKVKPLSLTGPGPSLVLTQKDVDLYNHYVSIGGSVVPVHSGEKLSLKHALEAVLLPSANNMADSLAIWAFGSLGSYQQYTNNMLKTSGLTKTTITSASGFSTTTVSTASDLIKLGQLALANPVIASIVSQKTATIPKVGAVHNVNRMLGQGGIIGIKTGNTDEAGGCFLFAAKRQVAGKSVTLVGAILGATNLGVALQDSQPLASDGFSNYSKRQLVAKNSVIGSYKVPWSQDVAILASSDLSTVAWKKLDIDTSLQLNKSSEGAMAGSTVGQAKANNKTINVVLGSDIPRPSWQWRLWQRYFN